MTTVSAFWKSLLMACTVFRERFEQIAQHSEVGRHLLAERDRLIAARLAGLNVLRLLNEPTAAAVALLDRHHAAFCSSSRLWSGR